MLATLTSKGQLTVPKAARDALDLKSGQRFAVEVSAAGDLILKPQRADALAVRGDDTGDRSTELDSARGKNARL